MNRMMKRVCVALAFSLALPAAYAAPSSWSRAAIDAARLRPVIEGTGTTVRSCGEPITNASVCAPQLHPDDGREYTTLVDEDFSLITEGSEDDPVKEFINTADFRIPSQYTHQPGWGGRAIMQAGGCVAIGKYYDTMQGGEMTGQIETPILDLHRDKGRAYLSFRAKSMRPDYDLVTVRWATESTEEYPLGRTGEAQTVYINGTQWATVNVDLTDCPESAYIQIWAENNEMLIDDIKLEQYQAPIDSPKALKWTDYTGDSFTAHWEAVEGADHYLFNCFYIRREGSEDVLPDYKYIKDDVETKELEFHLDGLDPKKVYYYFVYAVNDKGQISQESQTVEVLALCVPGNVRVSQVKGGSYFAEWDPVINAEGYAFQSILSHTAQEDENYSLLDETFDCLKNEGSVGSPYANTIGYYDMDSFGLSRANWVMYEGGMINGGLALHNYVSQYGEQYYGELVSPILSIGNSNGEITIEGEFCTLDDGVKPYIQIAVPGVVDGKTQWVLGAGGEVPVDIEKDWTYVSQTYKVKPGLVRFSIGCTDGGWLYIDNLNISVKLPAGAEQRLPYKYAEITENLEEPCYLCKTPDRVAGDHHMFAVEAVRQRPGSWMIPMYVYSDWSDLLDVPDGGLGVGRLESGDKASMAVRGGNGTISFEAGSGETLRVFDVAGRLVATVTGDSGVIAVNPGIYVVNIGLSSAKVVVR